MKQSVCLLDGIEKSATIILHVVTMKLLLVIHMIGKVRVARMNVKEERTG